MPVTDPGSGRTFIWLISCVLFICIIAGGGCLVAYMVLPESETASWIPIVGVLLVFLPWAFWILTFLYRVFSRCCGYRVRVGIGIGNGGVGGGDGNAGVKVVAQANGERGGLDRASSVASHESEMPLANSRPS